MTCFNQVVYAPIFFPHQDLCSKLQNEKQTLQKHTDELNNCVDELKEYVQALRERERLLVAFPELSPLAQPQSRPLWITY